MDVLLTFPSRDHGALVVAVEVAAAPESGHSIGEWQAH
jgi:hypothetical protein